MFSSRHDSNRSDINQSILSREVSYGVFEIALSSLFAHCRDDLDHWQARVKEVVLGGR